MKLLVVLVALCVSVTLVQGLKPEPLVSPARGGVPGNQLSRSWNTIITLFTGGAGKVREINGSKIATVLTNAYIEVDTNFQDSSRDMSMRGDVQQCNQMVDYNIRYDLGEIRILCNQPEAQITRYRYPSMTFIVDAPSNPKAMLGGMNSMNNLFHNAALQLDIVTSTQTLITVLNSTDYSASASSYTGLAAVKTSDASYDQINNIIWFAGADQQVIRLYIPPTTALDTTTWVMSTHPLNTSESIVAVQFDHVTGMVFATTAGTNSANPAKLFFIDVGTNGATFNVVQEMVLDTSTWRVTHMVHDPKGVLYLTTAQDPPSIVQISTVAFWRKYENTYKLPPNSGVIKDFYFRSSGNQLYVGCQNGNGDSLIYQLSAASACEGDCYGHGVCAVRNCTCDAYTSPRGQNHFWEHEMANGDRRWCSTVPCDSTVQGVCNGNSSLSCYNGTCTCDDRWTGGLCETEQCPKNCTDPAKGFCQGPESGFTCSCSEGWTGLDCAASTFLQCASYATCSDCLLNPGCGWCDTTQRCQDGNEVGPHYGNLGCRAWHFRECPGLAINVVSIIVAAVVGLLFVVNALSFWWEDSSAKENLQKRSQWYRFQRSSKAYAAWFQLQFYAVATILGSQLPTSFLSFTRIWLPVMGIHGYGLPGGPRNVTTFTVDISGPPANPPSLFAPEDPAAILSGVFGGRSLQSVDQAMVYADNVDESIFLSVLATWLVFTAGLIVLYLLVSLILCAIRGNFGRWVQLLISRPVYIFLRTTELAYFAIVTFSAVQMTRGETSSVAMIIVAAVFFVVVGILFPAGMMVLLMTRNAAALFSEGFTLRLYPFYGTLNHKKLIWAMLPWIKKFALGCVWGFGNRSLLTQLILSLIILAGYFVMILIFSPYTDYLQQILDIVTTALMFVSVLPLFAFVQAASILGTPGITAATILFMIFSVVAILSTIVFYIYSWCQMKGIFSLNQCKKCLSCRD